MSTWRTEGERCPDEQARIAAEANMDRCEACRYFRGASLSSGHREWRVCCNWPRDGSFMAETPLPQYIRDAWTEGLP